MTKNTVNKDLKIPNINLNIKSFNILKHIISHSNRVIKTVEGITKNDFLKNNDIQDIVNFNELQIGELVSNLPKELKNNIQTIEWKKIYGMRCIIVHGYGSINLDIVWSTATNDIPKLKTTCEEIIKNVKIVNI